MPDFLKIFYCGVNFIFKLEKLLSAVVVKYLTQITLWSLRSRKMARFPNQIPIPSLKQSLLLRPPSQSFALMINLYFIRTHRQGKFC